MGVGVCAKTVRPVCPVMDGSEDQDEEKKNEEKDEADSAEDLFEFGDLDCERGMRRPVRAADPKKPSKTDVEEHALTHLPFRSWCSHCVRGKGRVADHKKTTTEKGLGEIHMDYCFMGTADAETKQTIIVAKHVQTGALMSSVVPFKGVTHEFPAKRIRAFCKEMGLENTDIVMRGDQENSLQELIREVGRVRRPRERYPRIRQSGHRSPTDTPRGRCRV